MTDDECGNDGAFVLGVLSPTERQTYERHLAGCLRCQAAVRRLAVLPGLLRLADESSLLAAEDGVAPHSSAPGRVFALTGESPSPATGPVPLPATLMPALLGRVRGARLRRRLVVGGSLALAAACAAVLAIVLVARSAPITTVAAPNETVTMQSPAATPMAVTVALIDKQWGTSMTVTCAYAEEHDAGVAYELFVVDHDAHSQVAGSWTSIAGKVTTVVTATAVHRADIAALEVRLPNGQLVMRAST